MSEAFQYIDILILAIIAGIVLLRLRSVLGRRTGHEKTDKTSYNYETPQTPQEEKVIPIEPKTSSSKREDGWFDNDDFLRGAANAYETIVTNFENGNKDALKSFVILPALIPIETPAIASSVCKFIDSSAVIPRA